MKYSSVFMLVFATIQVFAETPLNPRKIMYSNRLEPYLTGFAHPFKKDNIFECPGDSFLTGVRSQFSDGDRRLSYACTFVETQDQKVMRKTSCKKPQKPDIIFGEEGGASHCEAHTFIDSVISQYKEKKRSYGFTCCHVSDWESQEFVTNSCVVYKKIHDPKKAFNFFCEKDSVIGKIEAAPEGGDMIMSFTCCSLK